MKTRVVLSAIFLALGAIGFAQAVPPGLTLEFDGQGEGRVIFSGTEHSGTGMYCSDCHMAKFDVSRASRITRPDHNTDQFCFSCHNGEMAFAPRRNCARCHEEEDDWE
jgi:c(7)-type cytochrome triheme protein